MKKLFVFIFVVFVLPVFAFAGITDMHNRAIAQKRVAGGGGDLELGYTITTGTQNFSASGNRISITVPAGGITISYGYAYIGYVGTTQQVSMGVYNTGGTLQGTCSTSVNIPTAIGWTEVTFTPFALSPGDYYIQAHYSGASASIDFVYDVVGTGSARGTASCGTLYTETRSNKAAMSVANYAAH